MILLTEENLADLEGQIKIVIIWTKIDKVRSRKCSCKINSKVLKLIRNQVKSLWIKKKADQLCNQMELKKESQSFTAENNSLDLVAILSLK